MRKLRALAEAATKAKGAGCTELRLMPQHRAVRRGRIRRAQDVNGFGREKNLPAPVYFAIGRRIGEPIRLLSTRRLASRSTSYRRRRLPGRASDYHAGLLPEGSVKELLRKASKADGWRSLRAKRAPGRWMQGHCQTLQRSSRQRWLCSSRHRLPPKHSAIKLSRLPQSRGGQAQAVVFIPANSLTASGAGHFKSRV